MARFGWAMCLQYLAGMSRTNAEVVRANSAAFSRRDVNGMLEFYASDSVMVDRRAVGWGEFSGHDAMRSHYLGIFDNVDELHEDLEIVFDEDDVIIASCRVTAHLAGQADAPPMHFEYALRFAFAAGVIKSMEIYEDTALQAALCPPRSGQLALAHSFGASEARRPLGYGS